MPEPEGIKTRRVIAVRVARFRLGEPARVSSEEVGADDDNRAGGDFTPADRHRLARTAHEDPRRRVQPKRFRKNAAGKFRKLPLRKFREQVTRPGERARGRLGAGHEECHQLVAQLGAVHAGAVRLEIAGGS